MARRKRVTKSAPEPTPEPTRTRVETVRDYDAGDRPGYNPLGVQNKQPGMRYRWVREGGMNWARKKAEGWEPVKAGDPEQAVLSDRTRMKRGTSIGGEQKVGDAILCKMPEEMYQKRIDANRQRIRLRTEGVTHAFRRAVGRALGDWRLAFEDHTLPRDYRDHPENFED